ncbi:uncharacterized protein TRAVEDRAFT_25623 [Trametes versicolor FP-101664 SS1]|uniref:uncharacterized protein n=1 Tax=Trametes versicolor (strain FP-101664) TaxID=717944 RepID=UPI00046231C0|nr:uncharacterized protein TRAVEDRAFT_25623 [Trametes versicolor FP-101664 SS1]EIW64460.1 hypothetical protein TRAVEDRAFT_25623 [Trametes versicolor FP-101664 SS1]
MHAQSSAISTPARSVASPSHPHASAHAHTTDAPSNAACHGPDSESCLLAASSPQCCHCGWRGAHAPTCPFK